MAETTKRDEARQTIARLEGEVIAMMAAFDRAQPQHRPWEKIVADVRRAVEASS